MSAPPEVSSRPNESSAVPIVKPLRRTTRPGIKPLPGSSGPSVTLRPVLGSNGLISPWTPNFGKRIFALLMRTSSWLRAAGPVRLGSYWITMPSAVTFTTFGTTTSRPATRSENLPGTLTRKLPLSRPKTSTWTSKVPRMPTSSAVTPLSACFCEVASLLSFPPKDSVARSTPMAIVSTSMPSLKSKSAMPIDGPNTFSGPRLNGLEEVPAPGAEASSVKLCFRPCPFWTPAAVAKEPATNSRVSCPVPKSSVAFCASRSLR